MVPQAKVKRRGGFGDPAAQMTLKRLLVIIKTALLQIEMLSAQKDNRRKNPNVYVIPLAMEICVATRSLGELCIECEFKP